MRVIKDFSKVIKVPREGVKAENERIEVPSKFERLDGVLISEMCLKRRIKELAKSISEEYGLIYAVVILKGAIVFFSDLARELSCEVEYDPLAVSSYKGAETTGGVNLSLDVSDRVKNKDVLIIEDIVDTGITLAWIRDHLLKRHAKSVRICALMDKPVRRVKKVDLDWVGFEIPDYFVVGFGLDYNQRFRNLPFVATLLSQ